MSEENRAILTVGLWFLSAAALVALFISAAAQGELTPGHITLTLLILTLAVIGTPLILRWKDTEPAQEKAKRQHMDRLLRDLSDEELLELKQRLADVDDRETSISDYLDDDGELGRRR